MAKKSQRRSIRYEKDQAGCMWGFLSIFDFHQGQSTRKLISDKRRTNRQVGAGCSRSKLHLLTNSNGETQEINGNDERETLITDDAKSSVKELMEEEMFNEQDQKKQTSNADVKAKESDSEYVERLKRSHKRTSKTSKSSCNLPCELDAAENFRQRDTKEKTSKKLDMEIVMNELCRQIYQKSSSCVKHDLDDDIESVEAFSVFDRKIIEAIKVFMNQRFTQGKHLMEDEKISQSEEFMDALQTLNSSKDLILKLLKDPNSLLVKQMEDLEDAQLEKDLNSNSLARSNMLGAGLNKSKPSEPVSRRQHNFFGRKSKPQEKILLPVDENCQTSNRIVILKPGPARAQISESEMKHSSSLQPQYRKGTNVRNERIPSQFSFNEIKRKLKHAIGKERNRVPSEHQNLGNGNGDKGIGREKAGWNSPNRNHFYNERFARPAIGNKKKDKGCQPKETETSMGNEIVDYPKLRLSNIYIEARKHLSEMMSNGHEIEDLSSRQLPKSLGRVLSLQEFNFSPICSPGRDKEHSFVVEQKRLSAYNNFHMINEDPVQLKQENHVSHLGPLRQNLNSQSCVVENPEDTVQSCGLNIDDVDKFNGVNAVDVTLCSMIPEKSSEDDVEIVETTDASVLEESKVVDVSAEQCSYSVIRDDQNGDLAEVCDEDESFQCSKLDSFEKDQLQSSPLTSSPSSSVTKHVGDLDSARERPEGPSPVSVLEPLFTEDDISPASIKSQPVEPPIQPLQMIFEEQLPSAINQEIYIGASMEGEESAFEYVEAVLLASDLNWEEFLLRWLSLDQILDAALFDEVKLFSNRSCDDQKLLFDCANEVLKEVCERYFGYFPWVSFAGHNIRPVPRGKDLIQEVWEEVEWHLLPQSSPCTLDQIVRKDMAKTGAWMDLQFDVKGIGVEIGEAVFEEMVEDIILSLVNEGLEIGSSLEEELIENEKHQCEWSQPQQI